MRITRDREVLKLLQEEYVKKVLSRFNMVRAKPMSTPLASHFWLSKDQSSSTKQGLIYMAEVSYASTIGSLMYVMACTRSDIAYALECHSSDKESVYHARTKHIQVRYHFIRLALEDGVLTLEKIQGNRNPVDMLTKTAMIEKLKLCVTSVGLFN
ncbi:Retrovirus-related Pol polyprotein from transposon TNT 1-94 [Vitis vinifera]|uniref:Retrovirus-related Pol polyprotein from transposon TNT 1-94 n=1 Tax=Vitis vinifera TaxID=29760 RepID=A0A438HTK8_VITVI|nr:Retrovirus-related Pol polyprotein from transposon TNT 1-94 [Vitis vinifera]